MTQAPTAMPQQQNQQQVDPSLFEALSAQQLKLIRAKVRVKDMRLTQKGQEVRDIVISFRDPIKSPPTGRGVYTSITMSLWGSDAINTGDAVRTYCDELECMVGIMPGEITTRSYTNREGEIVEMFQTRSMLFFPNLLGVIRAQESASPATSTEGDATGGPSSSEEEEI